MKKNVLLISFSFFVATCFGQSYRDSIKRYVKNYIDHHEVVKGKDRKKFHFYEPNPDFRVVARFEKADKNEWFEMPTSGKIKKVFRVYGVLSFTIHDTLVKMNLYQSQGLMGSNTYKDYLFLPFTDATSGLETYESGRYIDLLTTDIKNNAVIIDFNKAYNPYCAYVSGVYNCPVPPRENHVVMAITAGEMKFEQH